MTQINIPAKQNQTHRYREQACRCQRQVEGRKDWEFGISRCKILYIGWIKSKVTLYSPGNNIQYPMINHNGKKYICITESLYCTAEINTTLSINYTSVDLKNNFLL